MSRLLESTAHAALLAVLMSSVTSMPAAAQDFNVPTGTTQTSTFELNDDDTLTVDSNATLDVDDDAIVWEGGSAAPGVVITNSGTIKSTDRAIDTDGSFSEGSMTLNNNAGASIEAKDDGFRIDTDITNGTIIVDNSGVIASQEGRGLNFNEINSGTAQITIFNRAGGEIRGDLDDGMRPGEGAVVHNWGTIIGKTVPDPTGDPNDEMKSDGIDLDTHAGKVINYTGGLISGARHGITTDNFVEVENQAGATIIGNDGSGVGSDGDGKVTNYGTITGAISTDPANINGDGDGVDIDGNGEITNYGTIEGTGAKGIKDGSPNASEGIAMGSGFIDNASTTAIISGADNGILIDDSEGGNAPGATTITNRGTIRGLAGYGIKIIGEQNDTLTNSGLISGADGLAVDLGGGDDLLNVQDGAQFDGTVDGGAGTDKATLADNNTGTFGGVNFETIDVKSGAWTLTGEQSLTDITVEAGSSLAIADTISVRRAAGATRGTLNVTGNYEQLGTSTYRLGVNPDGTSDLIAITGAATLAGNVEVETPGGVYQIGHRYTILTADGGITGGFADAVETLPFIDFELDGQQPNNVGLVVTRSSVAFASLGQTANEKSVAAAADTAGGDLLNAVASVPDEAAARAAFNSLSGEIHASAMSVMLEDSRFVREAVTNRIRAGVASGLWGQAFGAQGSFDGDGNAASVDRSIGGFFAGADTKVGEASRIGFAIGYSQASFDADDRASSGDRDDYHVALYGGTQWDAFAVRLGAAYTWHELETTRRVALPGVAGTLEGDESARTAQIFGEIGYTIRAGAVKLEPFAGIAYVNLDTDGVSEHGSAAALSGRGSSEDLPTTTLGLHAAAHFNLDGATVLIARGTIGWRHALGDVTPTETLSFAGSAPFSIAGVPIADDALVFGAGLDLNLSPDLNVGVSYTGQIGNGAQDHGLKGNLSWRF